MFRHIIAVIGYGLAVMAPEGEINKEVAGAFCVRMVEKVQDGSEGRKLFPFRPTVKASHLSGRGYITAASP